MGRRLTAIICAIGGLSGGLAVVPAFAETASTAPAVLSVERPVETRTVELTTDSAIALQSAAPFSELSIANSDIADISTISNTSIYLLGKRAGRTTLMLMGEDGRVMSVIDVRVAPDISEFALRLTEILPGEKIEAFTANDGIVLTGRVSDATVVDRVLELASHYAPGRISNLLTVEAMGDAAPDLSGFAARLRAFLPDEEIGVEIVNGGIILSGTVGSAAARENAVTLAERFAPGAVTSLLALRASTPMEPDADRVAGHLAEILPGEDIRVHVLGGAIVLSGHARSEAAAQQAADVAALVAEGATITNMITVDATTDCTIRTRRGGEMVETTIPCRPDPARQPEAESAALQVIVTPVVDGFASVRPMPRPENRLAVN